jgi:TP901 family phage tail tape measure protein
MLSSELAEIAIVANRGKDAIAALRPELRAMSAQYIQPMQDLAGSLGAMTAKGLDFDQARAALPVIAQSATAARASLADMEGIAAAVMTHFDIPASKLSDPFDRLVSAANSGGFELRDMAQYLPMLAPSMAKIQQGAEGVSTLGAGLQVIRKGAGDAGQAATQMSDLLEKMFAPGTVDALQKKFNVDLPAAMKRWQAEGRNVFDAYIKMIREVTGGDAFKIAEIYGDKEGRAGLMSILNQWDEFERIRAASQAAPGQRPLRAATSRTARVIATGSSLLETHAHAPAAKDRSTNAWS